MCSTVLSTRSVDVVAVVVDDASATVVAVVDSDDAACASGRWDVEFDPFGVIHISATFAQTAM